MWIILSNNKEIKEVIIKKKYEIMVNEVVLKFKIMRDCLRVFLVGGLICDVG